MTTRGEGWGGMLPRKILDFTSSEMARNASETVYSDVNFQSYQLKYVFFSFEGVNVLVLPFHLTNTTG